MSFDPKVPQLLRQKQQWFASIIEQPIDEDDCINIFSPSGRLICEEALEYILPSPTMHPSERIQIYNQQFWWRLLNTLQSEFPLVTRLFGFKDFNQFIGVPYIEKYLPDHWSLTFLGNRLLQWCEEEYKGNDKQLVWEAIKIDWAHNFSHVAAHYSPLGHGERAHLGELENLIKETVYLQPHLSLFETNYHIFQLRNKFLEQDPDYWLDQDFPKIKKDRLYFFIFFRNQQNTLVYEEITGVEYRLLEQFRVGSKIENAINWLETQNASSQNAASENLHLWLQKWILNQWLTPHSRPQETNQFYEDIESS